jgi:hypothetical protein
VREDISRIPIVEGHRDDTGREPHREDQEEVEELMAGQTFLGQGVSAENRQSHAVDGSEDGDEEGGGIADPEELVLDDGLEGFELNINR